MSSHFRRSMLFSLPHRSAAIHSPSKPWGKAALNGDWAQRNITLVGRDAMSGTRAFFREKALCGGDHRKGVREQGGAVEIQRMVAGNKHAIGYSGVGNRQPGVKTVALASAPGEPFVAPAPASIASGKYPLTRTLYIYVNKDPRKPLGAPEAEFLKMILSRKGQQYVANEGFVPLDAEAVASERNKL